MRFFSFILPLSLLAAPAGASAPDQWKQLQQQAGQSCKKAAGLMGPRVSKMIVFDDRTRMVAMLVTGTFPQKHTKGARGTSLCLYDRLKKKASAEEAEGWQERR